MEYFAKYYGCLFGSECKFLDITKTVQTTEQNMVCCLVKAVPLEKDFDWHDCKIIPIGPNIEFVYGDCLQKFEVGYGYSAQTYFQAVEPRHDAETNSISFQIILRHRGIEILDLPTKGSLPSCRQTMA